MSKGQQQYVIHLSPPERKALAGILPKFAHRLRLTVQDACGVAFAAHELETIEHEAMSRMVLAQCAVEQEALCQVVNVVRKASERWAARGSIPNYELLYQFKITLRQLRPPIWRRIQVRDCSLAKFHEHIQAAMGWSNRRCYTFHARANRYGDPNFIDDGYEYVNSTATTISELVPKNGKRYSFRYEYVIGDGWEHEVLFEGCLAAEKGQRYPICVEGGRACPPESLRGVAEFVEFCKAIAHPEHNSRANSVQWNGHFDPSEFDAEARTNAMQRALSDWRQDE